MRRFWGFLIALVVAAPGVARADEDEAARLMRERFDRGQDYYEAHKFEAAAAEFRAAYAIKPAVALLFNEAVCYEKLKRCDAAVPLFRRYLDEAQSPRDRRAVEERIKACGTAPPPPPSLFVIETQPPGAHLYLDDMSTYLGDSPWSGDIQGTHKLMVTLKGHKDAVITITGGKRAAVQYVALATVSQEMPWLEVKANVPGADIFVDDKSVGAIGKTPYFTHILPGRHTIIVTKDGFTEDTRDVEVLAGQVTKVDAVIDRAPIGFVHVSGMTVEGARVSVDGRRVCESAPCRFVSPSGTHRVTVEKPGQKPYSRLLNVGAATETSLSVRLEKKRPRTDLIWKFGFAGAFLTGGVVLGLHAKSINDALDREISAANPPLPADDGRFTRGKVYAIAADGLFVVGAISATYAVLSLFSEPGPASAGTVTDTRDLFGETAPVRRPPVIVAPAVGPSYAGLAAEIRW